MPGGQLSPLVRFLRGFAPPSLLGDTPDAQLLQCFATQQDIDAFAAFVQRHGPVVFGVCRRVLSNPEDAEDAFQAAFLVLVRKAHAITRPDLLGNWLYGVAFRTALEAKTQATRRRAREKQVVELDAPGPAPDPTLADLRTVLDEEIARLPLKYRVAFVLCHVESRTNEEAARLLSCPKGTILSRLAWARERLRLRLTRRGLALSGAALATLLVTDALTAAVPQTLTDATLPFALNHLASSNITALAEGVIRALFLRKINLAVAVLLAIGLLGIGAGLFAPRGPGDREGKELPAADAKELRLTLRADRTRTVLNAEGTNVEPVQLTLQFMNGTDKSIKLDAYQFVWDHLSFEVTGPDKESVKIIHLPVERKSLAPKRDDYPVIEAGKNWTPETRRSFSGEIGDIRYCLLKPGEYRIRALYTNERAAGNDFSGDSWTGKVKSNVLVLTVESPEKGREQANVGDLIRVTTTRAGE
jgi:RNA polymerase sigma factor (sigma-70 family)